MCDQTQDSSCRGPHEAVHQTVAQGVCHSEGKKDVFSWSPRSKRLQSQKSPRSHNATQSQDCCVAATSHLASHGATQRPCEWVAWRLRSNCVPLQTFEPW
ncbi:hypothetical protein Y032_0724g1848 [Ancylostoma ceylanicum]|uniref:Uncharacterized protein n=1 Tax=Ancylostoma ceylanicum TaxID=53326 RepID=A0A016WH20_9BILA|nr:hypothetical protein Y032_0724g1848 [Ancylostoma ceylanicum]